MPFGEPARVRLESLTRAHAAELFPVLSHPAIYRYIPEPPPVSIAALTARYQSLEARVSPDGSQRWFNWAIRHLANAQCIGYVQATVYLQATADFAFVLGPAFWGLGLAHEASVAGLSRLFAQTEVTTVFATVDRRNTSSAALLARLRFRRVPAQAYPHGRVEDSDDVFRLDRNIQPHAPANRG